MGQLLTGLLGHWLECQEINRECAWADEECGYEEPGDLCPVVRLYQ